MFLNAYGADLVRRRNAEIGGAAYGSEIWRLPHSEAQVADLVESLVDVWKTLGLRFEEAKVIPLRPAANDAAHCVYPEMKRAAE